MGLERKKASLGSRLKANASGAINFTLSRTYLLRSLLLLLLFSPFLFVSLFISFTLALHFLVQFNCLHQLCSCCYYSSPDCRALCGWRRPCQQFTPHPSCLGSRSPKQYATQIFHYCNCRHLAASRHRYSRHSMRRSFRFLPHCALRFAENNTNIFHFIIIKAFELH